MIDIIIDARGVWKRYDAGRHDAACHHTSRDISTCDPASRDYTSGDNAPGNNASHCHDHGEPEPLSHVVHDNLVIRANFREAHHEQCGRGQRQLRDQ